MNICILSMQKVQNFGSLLQAYSLKKVLMDLGHDVSFIDIESDMNDNSLIGISPHFFQNDSEGIGGFWGKFKKLDKYTLNRINIKIKDNKQKNIYEKFRNEFLNINVSDNEKKYDCCVIGSDEVFNCMSRSNWGFTTQLFGNVKQAEKVITYAASCGFTIIDQLSDNMRVAIEKSFKNISAFSVRDLNTKAFVSELTTDKKIYDHLDPVLVGEFTEELVQSRKGIVLPEKYCLVYSYYNRINNMNEIEGIRLFCKKKGMKIITAGCPQKWCHNHLVLNPFELLDVFAKAEFVITDTFHGTIFSAKYSRRFAIIVRNSNKNKLLDLVKKLKLQDYLIESMDDLNECFRKTHDKKKFKRYIDFERSKTIEYLKLNLNIDEMEN